MTTIKKTFGWFPDASYSVDTKPSVLVTPFGDGYEQRGANGITPILDKWDLRFTGTQAEISSIVNFLKEHGGYKSFLWKTPESETAVFVCREWKRGREKGVIASVSMTFEQVPEL